MTPNPDCPDCRGSGEILMLHKMVPCACTERDEGLDARLEAFRKEVAALLIADAKLEAARKAMAPEKLVPGEYERVLVKGHAVCTGPAPWVPERERLREASGPISVNGYRVEVGKPLFLYLDGVKVRVVNEADGKMDIAVVPVNCF